MPPARPRAIPDDSRSETSSTITNLKDRTNSSAGVLKNKKPASNFLNHPNSTLKAATVNGALAATAAGSSNAAVGGAGDAEIEFPHTNWASLPASTLHHYRSAYKLQIPPSYTQPHADLLYKSSDVALRAPSAVLARRKLRDLKLYRKRLAQEHTNGVVNGGTRKGSKAGKPDPKNKTSRDDSRDGRRNQAQDPSTNLKEKIPVIVDDGSIALSIEPPSPTEATISTDTQPSLIPAVVTATIGTTAAVTTAENLSTTTTSDQDANNPLLPPSTLSQIDPESTIIGRQSPNSLATSIRKHFNAQQLNEAETIARFTYVVRQQGAGFQQIRPYSHNSYSSSTGGSQQHNTGTVGVGMGMLAGANTGSAGTATLATKSSGLGGGHIQVEGSQGDGNGWIMGDMGREVRMSDGRGGGTFRLRFRP